MSATRTLWLAWLCLQLPLSASAGPTRGTTVPLPAAERLARRCQPQSPHRAVKPQGTALWGTRRDWDSEKMAGEHDNVLVSVGLSAGLKTRPGPPGVKLEEGHLVATRPGVEVVGSVLQGKAGDGSPVEVAVCAAEPSAEDPGMVWYRIEAWNARAQQWENPCVALSWVPHPRALALAGVWDESGARHDAPGRFTFACENGALSKCADWGYKPWASRDGTSLRDVHQACTRMARADYCGNGRSHTHERTYMDYYDRLGVVAKTTESSEQWDVTRASFEAAWAPDGATCLAHTRDGRPLDTILQECPERLRAGEAVDLGGGDQCTVRRVDGSPEAGLLRNQSYLPRPR